jgi:serine O-acetyltransferase
LRSNHFYNLKKILKYEKQLYLNGTFLNKFKLIILKDPQYVIWKYIKLLRYEEFYLKNKNPIAYLILFFIRRKKNNLGILLGLEIPSNTIGYGLKIYHNSGGIIINPTAKIGNNCKFHGMNCVGNKGTINSGVPKIGNEDWCKYSCK